MEVREDVREGKWRMAARRRLIMTRCLDAAGGVVEEEEEEEEEEEGRQPRGQGGGPSGDAQA